MAKNYADLIVEAKRIGIAFTGQKPDELQAQIDARIEAMGGQASPTPIDSQEITNLRQEIQLTISLGAVDCDDERILAIAQKYATVLPSLTIDQVLDEEFAVKPPSVTVAAGTESVSNFVTDSQEIKVPVIPENEAAPLVVNKATQALNKEKGTVTKEKKEKTQPKAKVGKEKSSTDTKPATKKKDGPNENGQKILKLWAEGKTKNQIANELDLWYSQVDSCIKRWAPTGIKP